jgi:hypothetical protein
LGTRHTNHVLLWLAFGDVARQKPKKLHDIIVFVLYSTVRIYAKHDQMFQFLRTAARAPGGKTAALAALGGAALGGAVFVDSASAASKKPDLAKARAMISDIINDLDVVNPS